MCAPTAIGGLVSAAGSAVAASQANQERARAYEYRDRLRVNKAMRDDILYQNKKNVYKQNVTAANIAAQRAYTQSQISLNNAMSEIMLKNMDSFRDMLQAEGVIETRAAENNVRGKSIAKQLVMNRALMGAIQANRSRSLSMAKYSLQNANESTNIKLKDAINRQFSKVALQPVRDLPEPPPVMQNPGQIFALGAANAIAGGFAESEFEGWFGSGPLKNDINVDTTDYRSLLINSTQDGVSDAFGLTGWTNSELMRELKGENEFLTNLGLE